MSQMDEHEGLLTLADVARILNCGKTKVREILDRDEIKTVRIGRLVRVERKAIQEFIDRNCS